MSGAEERRYVDYLKAEWSLHGAHPIRSTAIRGAVSGHAVARVLDVGSGAGQEMQPLVSSGSALGVGIDIAPLAAPTAQQLYREQFPLARVAFIQASMESLPFLQGSFDVVICRLVLPYADNRAALQEMGRVLRPSGSLIVKLHHPFYYWRQLRRNIRELDLIAAIHTVRVLANGAFLSVTGIQLRNWLLGREVCQTRGRFLRSASDFHLSWLADLEDSNRRTPSLHLKKRGE
jgi:SAM-dependent methyltransferase